MAWGPRDVLVGPPKMMATYQMFQMTHRKPIAYGYLSHIYQENPEPVVQHLAYGGLQLQGAVLTEPDLRLDGVSVAAFDPGDQRQLAADGYGYVVWHKDLLARLQAKTPDDVTPAFLAAVFPSTAPVYEDASLAAYLVGSPSPTGTPTLHYGAGWSPPDGSGRRAGPSATLELGGMAGGPAVLRLQAPGGGAPGTPVSTLTVTTPAGSAGATLLAGQLTDVPLSLVAGDQDLTIALDEAALAAGATSFTVAGIDLRTAPQGEAQSAPGVGSVVAEGALEHRGQEPGPQGDSTEGE